MHRRQIAASALFLVVAMMGCSLQPTPTPVDAPANQVWIEWENHSDQTYAITIFAEDAESGAYGEVEPCTAHGMGVNVDEPFAIGIREWEADETDLGRQIADEQTWRQAGRRLLVVIGESGAVTLGTWTAQRASEVGFCD
jgi:hypothetical protein